MAENEITKYQNRKNYEKRFCEQPQFEVNKMILRNINDQIENNRIDNQDDMLKYLGMHSSMEQLWERGNYLIVRIKLYTDVKDPDIVKTITIVTDYDHKIWHLIHQACQFWSLPSAKFIITDERGVIIPERNTIASVFLSTYDRKSYITFDLRNRAQTFFDLFKSQEDAIRNTQQSLNMAVTITDKNKSIPKKVFVRRQKGNLLANAPRKFLTMYSKFNEYIDTQLVLGENIKGNLENDGDGRNHYNRWRRKGPIVFYIWLFIFILVAIE